VNIEQIEYTWGLSERGILEDLESRITRKYESPNVPKQVIDSYMAERISELEGQFGDEQLGDPIEVDYLIITTNTETKAIKVFNRGITLLFTDDEVMKRLHRFCCEITKEQDPIEETDWMKDPF
jgi:hypothetical protein